MYGQDEKHPIFRGCASSNLGHYIYISRRNINQTFKGDTMGFLFILALVLIGLNANEKKQQAKPKFKHYNFDAELTPNQRLAKVIADNMPAQTPLHRF